MKWSRYRPGVAQRVGRVIALLFHDRGTRRGWVVSSTPRPQFTPGKDPVPILQEAGWAPGPVWTDAENLAPPGFDPQTTQPGSSAAIPTELPGPHKFPGNILKATKTLFGFTEKSAPKTALFWVGYVVCRCNLLPTFRKNIPAPSSGLKKKWILEPWRWDR